MTDSSDKRLREWVGVLDLVAGRVMAEESVPDDVADDLQRVIDRISEIAEPHLGGHSDQPGGRSRDDGDTDAEQLTSAIRQRVQEIQKRRSQ